MEFVIKYSENKNGKREEVTVNPRGNVLSIHLPPQLEEGLPGLSVTINSDAVIVDTSRNRQLWKEDFSVMLADARGIAKTVNNFTNAATAAVQIMLCNNEADLAQVLILIKESRTSPTKDRASHLSDLLHEYVETMLDAISEIKDESHSGMILSLCKVALGEVNWPELAQFFLEAKKK